MEQFSYLVLFPALTVGFIAYLTTPIVIKLAWKIGIIDDPKKNKHPNVVHTYPTPRGGGLAIFVGILVASLIFLPLDKHLIGILAGAGILAVLGILDDKFNLHPLKRLVVQFLVAGIPIAAGIGIAYLTNPF